MILFYSKEKYIGLEEEGSEKKETRENSFICKRNQERKAHSLKKQEREDTLKMRGREEDKEKREILIHCHDLHRKKVEEREN